ncbi:MAG: cbb3-type cytochrome c oxidase subunit I [Solirubrobacterales bacterium]
MSPPPTTLDARPEVVTRTGTAPARAPWIERATSPDHKSVARLYLGGAASFLVIALVQWALMRVQLIVPDSTIIVPETFSRLLSASGVTFAVLFCVPLVLGIAGYVVPLQIGARGVALPRLNLLSAWLYLAGSIVLYTSFAYTPGEGGVLGLPPLSDTVFNPSRGMDNWIMGVGLATAGFVLFAVNMIVTVRKMRAPGMAWRRLPLFSWAVTVLSYVLLVVGPVMIAALAMLTIDRHFDGVFFDGAEGGSPLLYQHLVYLYMTGIYTIVVLFAAGVLSEIVPTMARKPIFSHRSAAIAIVAIGVLMPLAWMQNMYSAPVAEGFQYAAMAVALALVIPVGTLFSIWIATLWRGAVAVNAPLLFAAAAISALGLGLAGELAYSVIPVGWQLAHTTASQGDTLYVLVGGAVFGGFAALHYWLPKITGRMVGEGLAKAALAQMLVGLNLYVLMMFFAGLEGQQVDIFRYPEDVGLSTLNLFASIGAFIFVIGALLELGVLAHGYSQGRMAGHDPWGGSTLEWFALSPPPAHNFDAVPDVRSGEPLLDIRDAVRRGADRNDASVS